ncbi:RecQ family ATP-dependent DNA helicase [Vicingus serpentipes]|uniref:ATP-dependent DNA helicase RecQ n=1 Tax=Vicingus serpentipes TaxID=1926625 RepID=A0A5C6RXJ7_9FLAO|nr:ATP-dependent DNA helicase RecQ [Vicingus serpentipes]TXB67078.1 RecQ family ATP-dependent DNA helicase [Vicingus serpentipes]
MDIHQILLKYWGYNGFRPLQEDIINSALEGKDTLALLPTGGGKSICFQVPALSKEGICVVISPLIALMKDQVENLTKRGIKAVAIYSGMTSREIDITLDNCAYGDVKFLYVSPERIETEIFKERLKKMNVNLFAIDESHCISQWGYDFRPSYLNISHLRELKPDIPFLALTATATPEVVEDIQKQLKFKQANVLQKSFERKNIAYVVVHEEDKLTRLVKILNSIKGTSVVYVNNRKRTKDVAYHLYQNGISADFYHAGLTNEERNTKQNNWINNNTRVIVSTNAFGMGIDKPDVRTVVHMDLPSSLEAYFQEAGRAGRDEQKAYGILLLEENDRLNLEANITNSFPDLETIKNTYQALANYFQIPIGSALNESYFFDIADFSQQYNFKAFTVFHCLKFLEKEGYLYLSEANHNPSRIKFELNKADLYEFQVKNPKYDSFIKTILRSYAGLFENFTKINEFEIAKRLKTTKDKVVDGLHYLAKLEVISYIEQTNLPQLTYLTPRLESKSLYISKQHYHDRKEIAVKKMESVIYYAFSKHKCRSQILLSYYGEKESYRCGICDVCLERNKLELSDIEFSSVSDQLKKLLKEQPLSITDLVNSIKKVKEDKTIKVIQWLMENHKIITNDKNLLEWRK